MDTALSAIATLALLASCAVAALQAVASKGFTIRVPSGPDAMGIVIFFIFSIIGWLLTLLGGILAASRGVLAWIATPSAAAAFLTAVTIIALGVLSFLAMVFALERKPWRTAAGWAGVFILPLYTNLFLLILAWIDPAMAATDLWPRLAAPPLGLLAIASIIIVLVIMLRSQAAAADRMARAREREEESDRLRRAEAIERDQRHKAELDALPDETPLTTFVTHLFIDKSDAHHALALARIASLPGLAERFAQELRHPDPLQREYLLNYFRVAPSIDPALAAALRPHIDACFTRLAHDFDQAREQGRAQEIRHVRGMTLGLLLSAQRFPPRFDDAARRLRAALDRWDAHSREEALALVDRYLAGQTITSD